ncbi:hypothetical protein LIA77_00584 [Sarocladium implicatum]|nr:hypothetical protein LIA77_00584 [Sarocladium implicatum]
MAPEFDQGLMGMNPTRSLFFQVKERNRSHPKHPIWSSDTAQASVFHSASSTQSHGPSAAVVCQRGSPFETETSREVLTLNEPEYPTSPLFSVQTADSRTCLFPFIELCEDSL